MRRSVAGWVVDESNVSPCATQTPRHWNMPRIKLYESYEWMRKKYVVEKLDEFEIARLANSSQPTINRWLRKHGLKR